GSLDHKVIEACAPNGLVAVCDGWHAAAVVRGGDRTVIGRRYRAGALHGGISRNAGNNRRCGVIDRARLNEAAAIAASIGGGVGPFDDILVGAFARNSLVT